MRTYYDAVMSGRPILASGIQTLRDYVQDDLNQAGITFQWTWTTVSPGTPIEAKHLTEIRAAIQKLWDARQAGDLPPWQTLPGIQNTTSAASTLPSSVLAPNVVQGRTWLNQYELKAVPVPVQGLDSLTFRPADPDSPEISATWANDARALSPKFELVRSIVTARMANPGNENDPHRAVLSANVSDLNVYKRSFDKYQSGGRNLRIFLVFNRETYYPGPAEPNTPISDPVPPDQFPPANATNTYIEEFAVEVRKLIAEFQPSNAEIAYIIWNEPNDFAVPKRLEEFTFGALLHRVWQECAKNKSNPPTLYPAGIQTVIGHPGSATDYLEKTIKYVRYRMDSAGETGWPWSGLNFHIHQKRDATQFSTEMKNITKLRNDYDQPDDLLIGEWGVNVTSAGNLPGLYQQISGVSDGKPTKMFSFSHQRFFEKDEHENLVEWGCRIADTQEVSGHHEYTLGAETSLYNTLKSTL